MGGAVYCSGDEVDDKHWGVGCLRGLYVREGKGGNEEEVQEDGRGAWGGLCIVVGER